MITMLLVSLHPSISGDTMPDTAPALDLLKRGVPLALLFDIAGFGPSSEQIYRAEGSTVALLPLPELVAVAS